MSPEVDLHLGIKRNPRRSVKNKTRPFNFSYTLVLGACRRAKMSSLIWTWSKPNICTRSVLLTSCCRLELFYFIFIIFCSILFYYSILFYPILFSTCAFAAIIFSAASGKSKITFSSLISSIVESKNRYVRYSFPKGSCFEERN